MSPLPSRRIALVVMGVSGSGKSTLAASLAEALGLAFVDGDSLHSDASVRRMQAGIPLGDADRWPWLDRIGAVLADANRSARGMVVACSALRRAYRDRIRAAAPGVRFLFLDGPAKVMEGRMAARAGHYMPASLLASQLQTLERPGPNEPDVIALSIEQPVRAMVESAVRAVRRAEDRGGRAARTPSR